MPEHKCLGDGVSVTWTGYDYQIKANYHIHPIDTVFLKPRSMDALIRFVERIRSNDHGEEASATLSRMAKVKRSAQQRANLRCCASCEWIYEGLRNCPRCGFTSYGARFVHGDRAYRYKKTQEPWMKRKLDRYASELLREIKSANPQDRTIKENSIGSQ